MIHHIDLLKDKAVFDMDSSQLVTMIRTMEAGRDAGSSNLDGGVGFCAGAIVTPEAVPLKPQLIKFEKKKDRGRRRVHPDPGRVRP